MTRRPQHSAAWRRILLAAMLLTASFAGPGRADDDDDDTAATVSPPARVRVENGITVLTLTAKAQQNSGIETARPSPPPAQESVTGYGAVLDAAQLTELNSRYLDATANLQTADAKLSFSRAALDRAKTLYKDQQNMSMAQLQGAQKSFEVDQAERDAAAARLSAVAASARQAWGPVIGRALADRTPLATRLIERQDYLVKVTLPAGTTLAAAPPETVPVTLDDGSQTSLRFVSPATTADPKIQGASYFYLVPAESGPLPGLTILVALPTGRTPQGVVVVPESAIVWLQGRSWVYLRTGPESFVRREVAPDRPAPSGGGYLVRDLPADAEVAVLGAQMLLSEEFRAQVQGDID